MTRFMRPLGFEPDEYPAFWQWSVDTPEQFWPAVWRHGGVIADEHEGRQPWDEVVVRGDRMTPPDNATWFPGARLNFAENLLRRDDDGAALISWTEEGRRGAMSFAELRRDVARIASGLRALGVMPGDRVAGFLPNIPECVVAMLATASLGAVWSSCSPDFGAQGVLDRFGQIEPRVLFCADGYRYAGLEIDSLERARAIVAAIPSVERVVVVNFRGTRDTKAPLDRATNWESFGAKGSVPLAFERLPFQHPLYIMYSSGTTGLPKCMVHGAGGTLLQHIKELSLHTDLKAGDRIFYFTTCGWMMWNWLVSSLAVGASIVLYDGAPLSRREALWDLAQQEQVAVFGTSAKYLAMLEKKGASPGRTHDLSALRVILSTGSPLSENGFDFVYSRIKSDVRLSSISGGTDILSCFALGNPIAPVWRGELQTRGLGMAVEVWDEEGLPVRDSAGELVCVQPFPCMPVEFWSDPDGARYRSAYFTRFPNVWLHGDWAELTEHDGVIIHGRSDATLNPGGVRIGTAEIYRQVEQLDEIVESIVIGQDIGSGAEKDVRVVLFVRLQDGHQLDEELRDRIRKRVREFASPHHVPRRIIAVPDIPRTISGKITELAVRDIVHGRPVRNRDALANPEALEFFRDLPALND